MSAAASGAARESAWSRNGRWCVAWGLSCLAGSALQPPALSTVRLVSSIYSIPIIRIGGRWPAGAPADPTWTWPTMPDDSPGADATEHDTADHLAVIAEQSQRIAARFLSGQGAAGAGASTDPLNLSAALGAMARSLAADPSPLIDAQMKWWDGYLRLWQQGAQRLQGEEPAEPVAAPEPDDRRFRDPAWTENWVFDHLKQSYLLTAACVQSTAGKPARPRREQRPRSSPSIAASSSTRWRPPISSPPTPQR